MYEKVDDLTCGQFRLSCRGCGDVSREFLASPQQLRARGTAVIQPGELEDA